MRKLVDAKDSTEARRWLDRLLVAGIEAQIRPEDGTEVWVIADDDLPAARAQLDVPGEAVPAGKERRTAARAAEIRRNQRREAEDHAQRYQPITRRWGNTPVLGAGPITTALVVMTLMVALVRFLHDGEVDPRWLLAIDHYEAREAFERVRAGEVWRLVTPMFVHFGIFHLVFNLVWLDRLGRQVEQNHGSSMMLGLVLASAMVGNVGQYFVSGPSFGGMSGVNYGLFGFVWMHARYSRRHPYAVSSMDTVLMMGWFVLCATGWVGPIANVAHAAGLMVGLLLGLPVYVRHVRAKGTSPDFTPGSWADVSLTGWRRFDRRVIEPYVPLWFALLAALVIFAGRL